MNTISLSSILPLLFVVMIILFAFRMLGWSTHGGFNWRRYGERMKEAYAAKFGYRDPDFETQVDQHIAVMRVSGKGNTRDVSEAWLKDRAKFVEIPWMDIDNEASEERA